MEAGRSRECAGGGGGGGEAGVGVRGVEDLGEESHWDGIFPPFPPAAAAGEMLVWIWGAILASWRVNFSGFWGTRARGNSVI